MTQRSEAYQKGFDSPDEEGFQDNPYFPLNYMKKGKIEDLSPEARQWIDGKVDGLIARRHGSV